MHFRSRNMLGLYIYWQICSERVVLHAVVCAEVGVEHDGEAPLAVAAVADAARALRQRLAVVARAPEELHGGERLPVHFVRPACVVGYLCAAL